MAGKVKLFTLLGDHPGVMPLKTGAVGSDLVEFAFDDVKVPNTAFKALVRDGKYDCAELAIATFLQARAFGKPYALLPVTVMGRGQLHTLFMNENRPLKPEQLAGKSVGVRSYTVTTGVWVRGILSDLYGIDPNGMTWVSFEDPHVAEFVDPHHVIHAPRDKSLEGMLAAGEIDAAILGNTDRGPPLAPMFKDAATVDRDWAAKNGGVPINHMMVLRSEIVRDRPDVAREVYRMLNEAKTMAFPQPPMPDPIRIGIEDNRVSLDKMIGFCVQQRLIPHAVTVDELFDAFRATL